MHVRHPNVWRVGKSRRVSNCAVLYVACRCNSGPQQTTTGHNKRPRCLDAQLLKAHYTRCFFMDTTARALNPLPWMLPLFSLFRQLMFSRSHLPCFAAAIFTSTTTSLFRSRSSSFPLSYLSSFASSDVLHHRIPAQVSQQYVSLRTRSLIEVEVDDGSIESLALHAIGCAGEVRGHSELVPTNSAFLGDLRTPKLGLALKESTYHASEVRARAYTPGCFFWTLGAYSK